MNDSQPDGIGLTKYLGDRFLYFPVVTFEDLEEVILAAIDDPELLYIMIDSITSTIPAKLLDKDKKISDIEPGLHARYAAMFYQKYKPMAKQHKVTFFINQTRTKLDFRRGAPSPVEAAGGSAQKFYMDCRVFFRQVKKLEKNSRNSRRLPVRPLRLRVLGGGQSRTDSPGPFIPLGLTVLFGRGVFQLPAYTGWLLRKGHIKQGAEGTSPSQPRGKRSR